MPEIHINSLKQIEQQEIKELKQRDIGSAKQIIRFAIDNFEFALDIMDVREIKEMDVIRNLPNSQAFVKGLLNLRGDIIPVLDLKKKLELENLSLEILARMGEKQNITNNKNDSNSEKEKDQINDILDEEDKEQAPSIIICKVGSESFGIVVDKIYRVQYLSQDEYENASELFESIGRSFIKGFAKINNKIIVILSLLNLFF